MDASMTRGQFLKGAALGTIGVGFAGMLGGCSPSASTSDASNTVSQDSFTETINLDDATQDVDIVVVGAGAAGMSAAIEAADAGASVILVEANPSPGGTTQFAEGILGVNTDIQQKLDIKNDVQTLVNAELQFSNYAADARLIKDFLEGADANIDWLRDMGVEFYTDVIGGTTQHLYVNQGKQMIEKMDARAQELGVTYLLETRAKRLFIGEDGVEGLVVEGDNGEYPVKTKNVIFGCGGYIQNSDMMDEMLRFSSDRVKVTAASGHTGDHITMAYNAGADQTGITLLHFIWAGLKSFDLHSELSTAACNEPYFWIDEHGRRFTDESLITNPSCINNVLLNQKAAYSILTKKEVDRLATEGCTVGWGSYIFAGAPLTDLQNQLDVAVSDKPEEFYYAETVVELAEALQMDAETLSETISTYNTYVSAGIDEEFSKPAQFLHEVPEDGPFYAFKLMCNAFCTMGGIRVNRNNEVIDTNFEAIPGLYCAGVDCSGLQGTTYCVNLGGGAQAYAVYSGRNSAKHAAQR